VLPVVQQLTALCKDGLGQWCHWGATTQDITDTATVLQIRSALVVVEEAKIFDHTAIERLLELTSYLGNSGIMVDRVLAGRGD
jgi:hypothetical protein